MRVQIRKKKKSKLFKTQIVEMAVIIPITRRYQIRRVKKSSVLIINDLWWVRPQVWRRTPKVNMNICWNSLANRIYIFLHLPPGDRPVQTLRELLWRPEFLNYRSNLNVTPKKMFKWLKLCWDRDPLIF